MDGDVREILNFIDPASCDYVEWVSVGMALKNEGFPFEVWDEWSRRDRGRKADGTPRYDGTEKLKEKWRSFREKSGTGFGMGTIVYMAKRGGYTEPCSARKAFTGKDRALTDGDAICDGPAGLSHGPPEVAETSHNSREISPPGTLSPAEQLKKFLETLFAPDENVAYVTDTARYDPERARWEPRARRCRQCGELIKALGAHPDDLTAAVGRFHEGAGAWIGINPCDGEGASNGNVTAFRYCLVESDSGSKEEQERVYRCMRLPVASLTDSGGKSVHAVVRVDAENLDEYRERVNFVYGKVEAEGIKPDHANRNPSRLTRMPGVTRNGHEQTLLATDIGYKTYDEWKYFSDTGKDPPRLEQPANVPSAPPRPPAIIEGILEFGHKMIIAGPSKAGKSFFAIELGLCVSQGREFLGFKTAKSKVLYVNMEIGKTSFDERVYRVAERLGCLGNENFYALSLRGAAKPADRLVSDLIRDFRGYGFKCVIIDPVYKIMPGDENSADVATRLTLQLDRLSVAMDTAVIYVHHHSKGAQGGKAAIDRASGSGVLTRDADEIFNLTEIEVPADYLKEKGLDETSTVWELDMESRDFGRCLSKRIRFAYPVHEPDDEGLFDGFYTRGSLRSEARRQTDLKLAEREMAEEKARAKLEAKEEELSAAFDALGRDRATATELAKVMAGDPESAGYGSVLNTKRRMVYAVCDKSSRFIKGDKYIERLK